METIALNQNGNEKSMKQRDLDNLLMNFSTHQVLKFEQAIKSDLPTLFTMTEQFGDKITKAFLWKELSNLVLFVNVGKSMDMEQIKMTADFIIQDFSNLNLSDFKLFFAKFRKGDFGQLYDRIDGQIIYLALKEYKTIRIESAENASILEASQFKKKTLELANDLKDNEPGYSQFHIDAIKALLSNEKPKVNNLYENGKIVSQKESKPRNLAIDQVWMRQFNNLARGNKFRKYQIESPIRMIQVGNLKPMSITEFLEYKMKR